MRSWVLATILVVAVVTFASLPEVQGDVYGHNPRFSNNRLNETGQNRNNNNRLMDTQNNAKGGYCWGPKMYYYVGSLLTIEWTAQHSCSGPNAYCEIVLQYTCGDEVRDGLNTETPPDNADPSKGATYNDTVRPDPFTGEDKPTFVYGMHESYQYYQDCKKRERNKGLFLADQKPRGDAARYTRQNPGGGRSGFECPEERDYYPYWHPTPWKDIAVLANTRERCNFYQAESQNVKAKNFCNITTFNNEVSCRKGGGQWLSQPAWGIAPPDCLQGQETRDNHLGNTNSGYASMYNWTIPNDVHENCVLRIRYNISTADYDPWSPAINSSLNGEKNSPVIEDPSLGYMGRNYTMAFDTAQTGRTFQDRTHIFAIRPRPAGVPDTARIFNLNVRGKRGNIVQVYPAVEYDFAPQVLDTRPGDYIHMQWTGCDTNPANNDGEGKRGTDRSNIVQMSNPGDNYPIPPKDGPLLFSDPAKAYEMAHLGQYESNTTKCLNWEQLLEKNGGNRQRAEEDDQNCMKLNAAPAYWDGGLVRIEKTGTYHYMSTRNNNFSNRSQKGVINVQSLLPTWSLVLLGIGAALFLVGLAFGAAYMYSTTHPDSVVARALSRSKFDRV